MEISELLVFALENKASDLHLSAGEPPMLRIHGEMIKIEMPPLTRDEVHRMIYDILNDQQRKVFEEDLELDFSFNLGDMGRFRVNVFRQLRGEAAVFRAIPTRIPTFEELNLPPVLKEIARLEKGLVLVTGPTGSGKSTTLAAMIDLINTEEKGHIITIEDPIEFIHEDKKSIIDQREVGSDTSTFSSALRVALRQDPDVILVGEMRDFETIETALTAAETGHLVMSTLHTLNATETITRIISVFPPYHQKQVRLQLAAVLKGVISQRLVPRADGMGRVPAVEILVSTARVRECIIEKDKTNELLDAITKGVTTYGMQSFDQSLMFLLRDGLITYEEALKHCTNPDDFALRVKGILATSDAGWEEYEMLEREREKVKEETKKVRPERPIPSRPGGMGLKP